MFFILWIIMGIIFTWAGNGWHVWQNGMLYYYLAAGLLIAASCVVDHCRKQLFPTTYVLIRFALVFASLFLVLQKMIGNVEYVKETARLITGMALTKNLFITLAGAMLLFLAAMFLFKRMGTAIYLILGAGAAVAIPVMTVILTRVFTQSSEGFNGVYNSIKGFLIIGPIIIGMPFVCALCMSLPARKSGIRPGIFLLMGYTVVLCMCFMVNHDLGSALIVGGANIAFLLLCCIRGRRAKMFILFGIVLLVLISMTSTTVQSRVQETFNMFQHAYSAPVTGNRREETIQFASQLFTNLYLMLMTHGVYGTGYGNQRAVTAMNTDYIVYSSAYQLGIVFLLAFLILSALFVVVLWKYVSHLGKTRAQMHIMRVGSYLFIIPIVWICLCNLGLVPLTGISFPLLVYGKSSFWGYSILLGIMCGIIEKEKGHWRT